MTGYFAYGNDIAGNILLSMPVADVPAAVARVALLVALVMKMPLIHMPLRATLNSLLFPNRHLTLPLWFLIVESVLLLGVALGLAVALGNVSSAISIVGATGGSFISFIIPGMLGYAMRPPSFRLRLAPLLLPLSESSQIGSEIRARVEAK